MPQTWGLTRVSQGAAFAPRGHSGLSPGLPTVRELPPRVVTACSIRRTPEAGLISASLRLCGGIGILSGSVFAGLGTASGALDAGSPMRDNTKDLEDSQNECGLSFRVGG
jgi:hypothetical protein